MDAILVGFFRIDTYCFAQQKCSMRNITKGLIYILGILA